MPASSLPLVLLGAGGHAKVLLSMAQALGRRVLGVCDPGLEGSPERSWRNVRILGGDSALDDIDPAMVELVNGIGQLPDKNYRRTLHEVMTSRGFHFATLVHPTAWVDVSAKLGAGVQIMAGAVVQADCLVGDGVIVNTRASIDHDCHVGAHVHVAPGVTVCGAVHIQSGSFIGSGSVIIPGVNVGAEAVVGAGAVVLKDVMAGQSYVGGRFGSNGQKGLTN